MQFWNCEKSNIFVPTAFSPNGDGDNDYFFPVGYGVQGDDYEMSIYNRWGDKIYHWNDVNTGWDGKGYNGRNMEEGVYFYRMEATGFDGYYFEEKGSVTLLR